MFEMRWKLGKSWLSFYECLTFEKNCSHIYLCIVVYDKVSWDKIINYWFSLLIIKYSVVMTVDLSEYHWLILHKICQYLEMHAL